MHRNTQINHAEKNDFHHVVGQAIRTARKANGLGPRELALKAGLTASSIANAEAGQSCSLFVLVKIAEALDCTIDELVPTEATR